MKNLLLALTLGVATSYAGSPHLLYTAPGGGQRGTEVEVVCSGLRLEDARSLLFDEPGIEVVGVSEPEKGKFKAKLKIAPDARIGEHIFRAVSASGISDTRLFYVTPFPLVKEVDENKEAPFQPQPATLNTTIYGTAPGQDQDHYEVELKAGQALSAEIVGVRLSTQAQFDPYLIIAKADGTELVEMDDSTFTRQDPAVSIVAPEDGKYRVIVKEGTNGGDDHYGIAEGPCNYLLHLGTYPRPTSVFPYGGQAGEELKVQMLGDAGGTFEQTVKLPDAPDTRFEFLAQKGDQIAPQPNYLRVSPFPNVMEVEPNNDRATAMVVTLPAALNGVVEKGDADWFKFSAKKDESYDFTVYARQLRSPLDPLMVVASETAGLASNDDAVAGNADSYIRWKAPADGDYYVYVHDQLLRGGPLYTYRLEARPVQPKLLSYFPEVVINSSQERRAVPVPKGNRFANLVRVKRADVAGSVNLEVAGLPAGVTTTADVMDKTVDTVAMVFEAAPDAAPAQQTFTVLPKLAEPQPNLNVMSRVEHTVEVVENGNRRPYYGVLESVLPIAVTDEFPVTINVEQPKVPLLQNGSMNLKITAERRNDFKGAIPVQMLYVPPGIGSPGIITIPADKNECIVTIGANATAPLEKKWKICLVGSPDAGKGTTWISTALIDLEVAAPFIAGTLQRASMEQGAEETMTMKITPKVPFEGKATVTLVSLPTGVTSEPREITKDDTEVKFPLKATPAAQIGQHKALIATFTLVKDGETMTNTIASGGILRVDKGEPVAPAVADAK